MSDMNLDREKIKSRLESAGIMYSDLYGLVKDPETLARAAPLLLEILDEIESLQVKTDVVRVLAHTRIPPKPLVDQLKTVLPHLERADKPSESIESLSPSELVKQLKRLRSRSTGASSFAYAVCDALSAIANETVFDDLVDLIGDVRLGAARKTLPYALSRIGAHRWRVIELLIEKIEDEEIAVSAMDALAKMKAVEAIDPIRAQLRSDHPEVRSEAKRALAALERFSDDSHQEPASLSSDLPDNLEEVSGNFDFHELPVVLKHISKVVGGLGGPQVENAEAQVALMKPDEEIAIGLEVIFQGDRVPLQVRAFLDDQDAPEVAFFTSPRLARTIREIINQL